MYVPDYFQYFVMYNIFACSEGMELFAKNNPWRLPHCA